MMGQRAAVAWRVLTGSDMNDTRATASAPIILVPGFWLGAWAWDEVADLLRRDGHDVTALTLPGLESRDADRSAITQSDHVRAVCDAILEKDRPVILAVHSAAGYTGYAASDRLPDRIAAMVYVDSGPGMGAMDAEIEGDETPLPGPEELAASENLTGLSEEQLATFRERAVPEPAGVQREGIDLQNQARLDIPSTVIATGYTSDEYRDAVKAGYGFLKGLTELRDYAYVDLPTSHWPMWSRPAELAAIIGDVADAHGGDA
jgi:pimeloyl-ACP methyl ester carboxylesterase